jgi:protein TonB
MPIVISSVIQSTVLAAVAIGSLMAATATLPSVSPLMAFIAEMPSAAPPPPPPPPPIQSGSVMRPATAASLAAAPVEAPHSIEPEPVAADEGGLPGGVEGGILTGVTGIIPTVVEAPPPPPAPPRTEPRRIGGDLKAPGLTHRVEPLYPLIAQFSHVQGIVLLDAIVDANGLVQSVTVIKGHSLLTAAAIDAVKQWQYAPLLLNGNPIPFELTVTLVFHLTES